MSHFSNCALQIRSRQGPLRKSQFRGGKHGGVLLFVSPAGLAAKRRDIALLRRPVTRYAGRDDHIL